MNVYNKLVIAVLVVVLCSVTARAADEDSKVNVLTVDSFDEFIAGEPLTLVEFFAPWCGHCKKLAPEYASAADTLDGEISLASVDCTAEETLCSKYGVRGFPTLKVFRGLDDEPAEYQGGRTAGEIVKYMRKQNEPAFVIVNSADELEAAIAKTELLVVAVADEGSDAYAKAQALANEQRGKFSFVIASSDAVASGSSAFKLYADFNGDSPVEFDGDASDIAAVKTWLLEESFPLLGEIGPETYEKYVKRGLDLYWVFVDPEAENTDDIKEQAIIAAKQFKGKYSFVWLDGVKWGTHGKSLRLKSTTPGFVLENRATSSSYVLDETVELDVSALADRIVAQIQAFEAGTLAKSIKTEPEPEDNSGPVTVLVATNFERIVFDNDKDVLVEFYAPWCGHCKRLAPKYDALGAEFADDDSVVIAKVDATANDVPMQISGFPTLYFYPAGAKDNPIQYEGGRTTEDLAEFVRDNAAASGSHEDL